MAFGLPAVALLLFVCQAFDVFSEPGTLQCTYPPLIALLMYHLARICGDGGRQSSPI